MGDFSRSPQANLDSARKAGYVGLHIEQGVPLLDRDLNLLQDLIVRVTRDVIARYIGSGIAAEDDGFQIRPSTAENDLVIGAGPNDRAGSCLVDGLEVRIPAPLNYVDQGAKTKLTTPRPDQPDPRTDLVYLDVWLDSRDGVDDTTLGNPGDVGIQTSVRLVPAWAVRVAEDAAKLPDAAPGHSHHPLAGLTRRRNNARVTQAMITDRRQRGLTVTDLERRMRDMERLRTMPAFGADPFRPPVGAPRTEVTITGRNFDLPPVSVTFGGRQAPTVTVASPTSLTATVPDGVRPGLVEVTVTNAAGTTASGGTLFNARGSKPVISGFSPPKGRPSTAAGPATEVVITGDHFDENIDEETTVLFGGADQASIASLSNTKIVTSVPITPSGANKIIVTTQWGTVESVQDFTVFQGIPS